MHNPWKIVEMFEENMAEYCGSKYAVATDSCTSALFMCCIYYEVKEVTIPLKTYLSVPQSVIHAGGKVKLKDYDWKGVYQLFPYPIYDSAKRLTSGMYIPGTCMCLSFHLRKILNIGKGGMILTDDKNAAEWFKKARYEGRDHISDLISICGWNMYMTPEQAARGMSLLQLLPLHNNDQQEAVEYKNLSSMPLYKNCEVI